MAGIQLTLISSRVGRRVATLFVLCGLLPLVVLAVVTSWGVSNHLREQEEGRLRSLAKASAMASFSRLLDAEERLHLVASEAPAPLAVGSLRSVIALTLVGPSGRLTPLRGPAAMAMPALDAAQRTHLAGGGGVLLLPAHAFGPLRLVVPVPGGESSLVAALEPRELWGLDETVGDGGFAPGLCGAVDGLLLACTDTIVDPAPLAALLTGGSGGAAFETRLGDDDWMGAHWAAPVRARYAVDRWTSVVVTRRADALAPAQALIRTVTLIVAATLCTVLLVSFHQIRRLLDPLAVLERATARLADGDFQSRVDIRSGDELQQLGDAFNGMAADLQQQFEQLRALSVGTLEALARTIDAKSPWTAGHSARVAEIARAIARALHLEPLAQQRIHRGALLHDIGKIGVPAAVIDKAGRLTDDEMALMREHPAMGARILEPLPHCTDILPMVLQHHERLDGSGYPKGLAGDAIAFDARLLAVADVYDAMTSDRPYRRALPARDVAAHIAAAAGTHFDPVVVEAFLQVFRDQDLALEPTPHAILKSA
jgi:putative nucleotidyltransferase with HDIG domain